MARPLMLTVGEPAGIGPDCILLAYRDHPASFDGVCLCAPADWLAARARELGIRPPITRVEALSEAARIPGLCCWNPVTDGDHGVTAGRPSKKTSSAVLACIRGAAGACMRGEAGGLVTGPIEKSILQDSGFDFPGHTEYLAHLAGVPRVVMMLSTENLRVALLTTHMALRDVAHTLNIEDTMRALRIIHDQLSRLFGIPRPKLALCGLNPHAGEAGHFGREEVDVLQPAAKLAAEEGMDITPPMPADSLFARPLRDRFDAIVCCYHDQGLIPVKALSFGNAVNITLGLPFIRTSVDHGTALTRAGTGDVSYSSLMAAIDMAKTLSRNQG